mmetsp:Transcript_10437/g.13043  ORF Transcript_10437/g.13043 Transcript_10437/m.13043 type:complete len:253 (-) Transcript_10437:1424-2182(-)
MLLCTVRQVKNTELRCCFEILSPNKRPYMLQAVNENEMNMWMDAIRRAIESQLVKQQQRPSISRSSGKEDPEIALLLAVNERCADCNAANPDWVSINLGVVICIECSGIHRSLGTHISKVRSLGLDRLSRPQIQLLRRLGNSLINSLYEYGVGDENEKLEPADPQSTKEKYIRRKYEEKAFMKPFHSGTDDLESNLFRAVECDDLETVVLCIAKKANLNVVNEAGMNALQITEAKEFVECHELLILNGAEVS